MSRYFSNGGALLTVTEVCYECVTHFGETILIFTETHFDHQIVTQHRYEMRYLEKKRVEKSVCVKRSI